MIKDYNVHMYMKRGSFHNKINQISKHCTTFAHSRQLIQLTACSVPWTVAPVQLAIIDSIQRTWTA